MERILILLCVVSFPAMTEIQIKSVQTYFAQVPTFIIVDNSKSIGESNQFQRLASQHNCHYLRCDTNIGPSENHAACLNMGTKLMSAMAQDFDFLGILDNDLFPMTNFNIRDYLNEDTNAMSAVQIRGQIRYLWPGFAFWSRKTYLHQAAWDIIAEFNAKTDSGGATYYHLQANPHIHVKDVNFFPIWSKEEALRESIPNYLTSFFERMEIICKAYHVQFWHDFVKLNDKVVFFHLRDMSNWKRNSPEFVQQKFREFQSHWPIKHA